MYRGYIKLYRKLMENALYKDCTSVQRDILITILLSVNHSENKWIFDGKEYTVKPGQMITSLESIRQGCARDVTTRMVRTALVKFEKYGFLTSKVTNKNRLITVANWGIYQVFDEEVDKQVDKQLTSNGQAIDKQLTSNGQAVDKQLTTNKNVKNVKNEIINKKQKKIANAPVCYFHDDENLDNTFKDFIDMRKKIKAPMTEHAIDLMIGKIKKLDRDIAIQMINQSIMNSWKDIYPIKEEKNVSTNKFNNYEQRSYTSEDFARMEGRTEK